MTMCGFQSLPEVEDSQLILSLRWKDHAHETKNIHSINCSAAVTQQHLHATFAYSVRWNSLKRSKPLESYCRAVARKVCDTVRMRFNRTPNSIFHFPSTKPHTFRAAHQPLSTIWYSLYIAQNKFPITNSNQKYIYRYIFLFINIL